MKKLVLLFLAALAALPLAASAADANVYADVLSAYVYRGQVGNDEAVFQPGLDVTGPYGLGASFWGNMNLTDNQSYWYPDSQGKWGEVDLGLNWSLPVESPVSLTVGGTYFTYPQDASTVETDDAGAPVTDADGNVKVSKAPADGGYEAYVTVAAADVLLTPTAKFCHDLDNTDDWLAIFSISHSLPLMDVLSLDLGASLGYAGEYYVSDNYNGSDAGAAFTYYELDAALSYALTEKISVSLKGGFSSIIDSGIRDDIEAAADGYSDVDIFFGGANVSCAF